MATLLELKQRLIEAEAALHRLLIGELEVKVEVGGFGETTYTQTNVNQLRRYISELKTDISKLKGRTPRRPILFKF